jgi:hypothetical protein
MIYKNFTPAMDKQTNRNHRFEGLYEIAAYINEGDKEMSLKKILIVFFALAVLTGCSKKEEKTDNTVPEKKTTASVQVKKVTPATLPRVFKACDYTNDIRWRNGINWKEKNQFFISIGKKDLTPILPGYNMKFARTGEAKVLLVHRVDDPNKSNIFVTVNKTLDPNGDGFPNPIYLKSYQIQPGQYSKENVWKNGISLKTQGVFFFQVDKKSLTPVKIQDRLKFAATGEGIIMDIFRDEAAAAYSSIFVTVNRIIDPIRDGYPNFIDLSINEEPSK